MSRAGIGKTAFLIDVAIDDLLQERKVLHVTLEDSVERLRDFYDTLFAELGRVIRLEDPLREHLSMERNRMIHAYRGGDLSVEKLRKNTEFLRDHAHFAPEVIILDGVDFLRTTNEELAGLKALAQSLDAEVWLSARSDRARPPADPRGVDDQVIRFRRLHQRDGAAASRGRGRDHAAAAERPRERERGALEDEARPDDAAAGGTVGVRCASRCWACRSRASEPC